MPSGTNTHWRLSHAIPRREQAVAYVEWSRCTEFLHVGLRLRPPILGRSIENTVGSFKEDQLTDIEEHS